VLRSAAILLPLLLGACVSAARTGSHTFVLQPLASPATASLRGLSVVDERVVWASGAAGTVLRTTNGGASWELRAVPGADSLDFRDIEAFDSLHAYLLSAGEDGRIYYTSDGGRTWSLQFRNQVKGAFFDCFDFYDRTRGIAMSDPVDGRYLLLTTTDGRTWTELGADSRPAANANEAAFAASGTCLTIAGNRAYLATGGGAGTRVLRSIDGGRTWTPSVTPVPAGDPGAGIFALAFRDAQNGIAIGGNYQQPQQTATVAITRDGGLTWSAVGATSYTSGAAWSPSGASLLAVGTPGTRLSRAAGTTWENLDANEYHAVQFASEQVAYAVGPRGRMVKLLRR
jgi:photosystem II stability/assembly factor-like uncharacterized protein